MKHKAKTQGKPADLKTDECFCSTDEGDELVVLTGSLEWAAKEAADEFFNRSGDNPESQIIKVERGDGVVKVFKVVTEFEPSFYIESEVAPNCPLCESNTQVWVNQITHKLTCHRVGCNNKEL
mgnify:CR=1 FL=1